MGGYLSIYESLGEHFAIFKNLGGVTALVPKFGDICNYPLNIWFIWYILLWSTFDKFGSQNHSHVQDLPCLYDTHTYIYMIILFLNFLNEKNGF